jgi:hypothetical protein
VAQTPIISSRRPPKASFKNPFVSNTAMHESLASCTTRWHSALAQVVGSIAPTGVFSPRCSHTPLIMSNTSSTSRESELGLAPAIEPHRSSGPLLSAAAPESNSDQAKSLSISIDRVPARPSAGASPLLGVGSGASGCAPHRSVGGAVVPRRGG